MTKCLKLDNLSKILINLAKLYLKKLDFINTVIPKSPSDMWQCPVKIGLVQ